MPTSRLLVILAVLGTAAALECYTGFNYVRGKNVGTSKQTCSGSSDYCYNVTADIHALANIQGAGCSTIRCILARNKCISQKLGGKEVSFCCCNTGDLCNSKYTGLNALEKGASKLKDIATGIFNLGK